jgi:hypothetical protein
MIKSKEKIKYKKQQIQSIETRKNQSDETRLNLIHLFRLTLKRVFFIIKFDPKSLFRARLNTNIK